MTSRHNVSHQCVMVPQIEKATNDTNCTENPLCILHFKKEFEISRVFAIPHHVFKTCAESALKISNGEGSEMFKEPPKILLFVSDCFIRKAALCLSLT